MDNEPTTITVTKAEYEELLRDSKFLNSLKAYGVNNWEGYSEAYWEAFPEEEDDD